MATELTTNTKNTSQRNPLCHLRNAATVSRAQRIFLRCFLVSVADFVAMAKHLLFADGQEERGQGLEVRNKAKRTV